MLNIKFIYIYKEIIKDENFEYMYKNYNIEG